MSCGSSPGVYLRCSLNSTEKPWNGLACRPCKNPLTMNCARKSSREIWRITSGFRYFSTVDMAHSRAPLRVAAKRLAATRSGALDAKLARELRDLRHRDFAEQAGDQVFGS